MEEKKSFSSFPSNYVTLAQLQERWLKQQSQVNQPQPEHPPPSKQHRLTNRNDSQARHRSTGMASDDRKSEAGAKIENENADLNGKVSESKNINRKTKKVNRKHRVEKKEGSEGASTQRNREAEKTSIKSTLNEENDGSITMEDVEQKVKVLSVNPEIGKQNERLRKNNNGFPRSISHGNYFGDRRGYGYGQQHSKVGDQRREKMVWVRKDGNGGEIET